MIVTAGQQEQGHGLMEPLLYGPLVDMAKPNWKWSIEVTRLEDLPRDPAPGGQDRDDGARPGRSSSPCPAIS